MELTFIGHQSWMLSSGAHRILVDPILDISFGTNKNLQFELRPSRRVYLKKVPAPSAVILSTEHLQHFQPRSFKAMRDHGWHTPVFVHRLFPACAVEILTKLGFTVQRLADGEVMRSGPFEFALFTNSATVLPWDRRVASVAFSEGAQSIVIQSDTIPSPRLANWITSGKRELVALIATNNSFAVRAGTGAGLSNIFPVRTRADYGAVGARSLIGSLLDPFKDFPFTPNLIIVGAGYRDTRGVMLPPQWTQSELAALANQLSLETRISAPRPGQCANLDLKMCWSKIEWISELPDHPPTVDVFADDPWRMLRLFPSSEPSDTEEQKLMAALSELAQAAILAPFGKTLVRTNRHLDRWLGRQRFVLQLMESVGGRDYSLDLTDALFHEVPHTGDDALRRYPFGIRVSRADFIALLDGDIQIWELSLVCARQWYISQFTESPMAFLYSYFAESIRQDLAATSYARDLQISSSL
jgi:hypothetical protein